MIKITTIKGPIVFKKGGKIPKEILKKVSMPFRATGWKSEHLGTLVQKTEKEPEPKQEPKLEPEEKKESMVTVVAHDRDVIPGKGVRVEKIESYERKKPRKRKSKRRRRG